MKNLFNDILLLYYLYRHELVVTIKCQIKLHYMCFQNLNPLNPPYLIYIYEKSTLFCM